MKEGKLEKTSKEVIINENKEYTGPIGKYGLGNGLAVYLLGSTIAGTAIAALYHGLEYLNSTF